MDIQILSSLIDLLPLESYVKVENLVEQLLSLNVQNRRESAFRTFLKYLMRRKISCIKCLV